MFNTMTAAVPPLTRGACCAREPVPHLNPPCRHGPGRFGACAKATAPSSARSACSSSIAPSRPSTGGASSSAQARLSRKRLGCAVAQSSPSSLPRAAGRGCVFLSRPLGPSPAALDLSVLCGLSCRDVLHPALSIAKRRSHDWARARARRKRLGAGPAAAPELPRCRRLTTLPGGTCLVGCMDPMVCPCSESRVPLPPPPPPVSAGRQRVPMHLLRGLLPQPGLLRRPLHQVHARPAPGPARLRRQRPGTPATPVASAPVAAVNGRRHVWRPLVASKIRAKIPAVKGGRPGADQRP